jgi:predicted NBD/HSP70 family sugar kinase
MSRIDGLAASDAQLGLEQLVRRADAADPDVTAVLTDAGTHLGHGVAAIVNLLNPGVVILGGAYALLSDHLVPAIEKAMLEATIAPDAGGCRLAVSTFPRTATPLGAAVHALSPLTRGKLPAH